MDEAGRGPRPASATNDGSGAVATTPAETSERSAVLQAGAGAPSETGGQAETGGTSKPKSPQRSGQPRRRKPAGSTATMATTGDPSETTGSPQPPLSGDGAEQAETAVPSDGATTPAKKRRRRRGGRGRSRKPAGAATADADADADDTPVIDPVDAQRDEAEPDADAAAKPPARRRRRTSSGRADDPHRAHQSPDRSGGRDRASRAAAGPLPTREGEDDRGAGGGRGSDPRDPHHAEPHGTRGPATPGATADARRA